jgi:hypothetical protein
MAMHHHPENSERALRLSILAMYRPSSFPHVESNKATVSMIGDAVPLVPLSLSLATKSLLGACYLP